MGCCGGGSEWPATKAAQQHRMEVHQLSGLLACVLCRIAQWPRLQKHNLIVSRTSKLATLVKLSTIGYLLQRLLHLPHGDATALLAAVVMASGGHRARAPTATKAAGTGWPAVAAGLAAAAGGLAAGRCVSPAHGLLLHRPTPSAHCPVSSPSTFDTAQLAEVPKRC
jgi:hypothetical protein